MENLDSIGTPIDFLPFQSQVPLNYDLHAMRQQLDTVITYDQGPVVCVWCENTRDAYKSDRVRIGQSCYKYISEFKKIWNETNGARVVREICLPSHECSLTAGTKGLYKKKRAVPYRRPVNNMKYLQEHLVCLARAMNNVEISNRLKGRLYGKLTDKMDSLLPQLVVSQVCEKDKVMKRRLCSLSWKDFVDSLDTDYSWDVRDTGIFRPQFRPSPLPQSLALRGFPPKLPDDPFAVLDMVEGEDSSQVDVLLQSIPIPPDLPLPEINFENEAPRLEAQNMGEGAEEDDEFRPEACPMFPLADDLALDNTELHQQVLTLKGWFGGVDIHPEDFNQEEKEKLLEAFKKKLRYTPKNGSQTSCKVYMKDGCIEIWVVVPDDAPLDIMAKVHGVHDLKSSHGTLIQKNVSLDAFGMCTLRLDPYQAKSRAEYLENFSTLFYGLLSNLFSKRYGRDISLTRRHLQLKFDDVDRSFEIEIRTKVIFSAGLDKRWEAAITACLDMICKQGDTFLPYFQQCGVVTELLDAFDRQPIYWDIDSLVLESFSLTHTSLHHLQSEDWFLEGSSLHHLQSESQEEWFHDLVSVSHYHPSSFSLSVLESSEPTSTTFGETL